jgi:elongation factor G
MTPQIVLESMTFPEPVISLAVEPKTTADEQTSSPSAWSSSEEDPTFKVSYGRRKSGQTIIAGMGELHLEIIVDRSAANSSRSEPGCTAGRLPRSHTKNVEHRETYKKQTGGRGKFADVSIEFGPAEKEGEHFEFVDEIKGGVIPERVHSFRCRKVCKNAMVRRSAGRLPAEKRVKARLY